MATYMELRNLFSDDTMKNRVDVAIIIAANNLLGGTPTPAEQGWAAAAFNSPRNEGQKAFMAVLAANKGASVAAIKGATDTALQANVDAVVATLVIAHAALAGV